MNIVVLTLLLSAATGATAAGDDAALFDIATRMQYAWYTRDLSRLVELTHELQPDASRDTAGRWAGYYTAYGYYRAAGLAGEDYVVEYLNRCSDVIDDTMHRHQEFAEALILKGACSALLAERRPIAAVLAPSRALRAFAKAALLDPDNPRLKLAQATAATLRKSFAAVLPPPARLLEEALKAYAVGAHVAPPEPDWGEAEAYLLDARLALGSGDRQRARDAAEQALQIAPDYADGRDLLDGLRR